MEHLTRKPKSSYIRLFFLYLGLGLLVDLVLIIFFTFFDVLEILNLSLESILNLNPSLFNGILLLYLCAFLFPGVFISVFLFIIYFCYKEKLWIKKFISRKCDFLLLTWFLFLYPVMFDFYLKKIFHVQLEAYHKWLIIPGLAFLLVSLLTLFSEKKIIRNTLFVFRSILLLAILSVFSHHVITNISFPSHDRAQPQPASRGIDQKKPADFNVLLITIDTCRADKLSCYHFGKQTSPNIDALADEGFIFDHAFSTSNWTRPASASLFTSVYPGTHQTNTLVQRIASAMRCLPEYFKEAGYHTAVFSANDNISPDFGFDQGVDYFYETTKKSMVQFSALYIRLTRRFPRLGFKLQDFKQQSMISEHETEEEALYNHFFKWLRSIRYGRFFANIHFNTPHASYDPPVAYDVFAEDPSVRVIPSEPEHGTSISKPHLKRLLSLYYGEIYYADAIIGKIIEALRQAGLFEKTIIVVSADHGEEFFDHKSWGHAHTMYNELLRIPLIFYIPNHPNAPARIENYISIIDVGPTLLSLVNLPGDAFMDGKDLTPLLQGESQDPHEFIFAECLTTPKDRAYKSAIIGDGFKYIEYRFESETMEALFNLEKDFKEKRRLPLDSGPHYERLKEQMAAMKAHALSKKIDSDTIQLSKEKEEQLKALGYME